MLDVKGMKKKKNNITPYNPPNKKKKNYYLIMKAIKCIGITSAVCALLCMSGYDCPECNFAAQTIALSVCVIVAVVCGMIWQKLNER